MPKLIGALRCRPVDAEFRSKIEPFRRELLAHCYRMTGAFADAEDLLQDSLLRAWRGLASFEGRASLRTWLYRVTTNTCLNALASARVRSMPHVTLPEGAPDDDPPPQLEPVWLEPYPDAQLPDDAADRPDAVYARRESIRLAFIIALQQLPPRQRAVLLLRDVIALSAEETAELVELSLAACNSLLQRAREGIKVPRAASADDADHSELLSRYVSAWESGDAAALVAVLREDAIASMPPSPLWVRGHDAIIATMRRLVWTGPALQLVPFAANGAPAFAMYQEREGVMTFAAITVLGVAGGAISSIDSFLAVDPARYGLARVYG